MMVFSQMHMSIVNVAFSFSHNELTHIKDNSIERDQYLFKYKRWETMPSMDFKFLLLQLTYKYHANKFDLFKLLNEITPDELQELKLEKQKIILYTKTLQEDIEFLRTKVITPALVSKLFTNKEISILGFYYYMWHFKVAKKLSRIQERKLKQVQLFFKFLPKIENHIATIYERNQRQI